ncbi:unnamed protein product [Phytophthora fragariaefolia]|uniref:Unnamed protein product n=1 Tax=Phytophthora fragariaefolia TaxID=1490495 RepID=A0A9W6WZV8_9STRA|nr:unnamed protein product [Phytophthora fragariaefolia]
MSTTVDTQVEQKDPVTEGSGLGASALGAKAIEDEREAEEVKPLITESVDILSAKSKKEHFDEQSWDAPKSSPLYEVLRENKDIRLDDIPSELPQGKGVQHEIDLVSGTKSCVTRQWPLPQVKAIDDFFESRLKAGQVRKLKSPHSVPTFCVKKT